MPAYDYTCPVCGHKEERIVRMEERDEQTCGRPTLDKNGSPWSDHDCPGKLERDEIALTARMSDQWKF